MPTARTARPLPTSVAAVAAVAAVAIAARLTVPVPGTDVPQSAQTLAVVLVGAFLGPARGAAALGLYLVVGAVGLPVFADGASGVARLWGPTSGYLLGFVVGAAMVGWVVRTRRMDGLGAVAGAMVAAHAAILLLGWARLAVDLGPVEAYVQGVHPFFVGAVVKSLLGAMVVVLAAWIGARRHAVPGP